MRKLQKLKMNTYSVMKQLFKKFLPKRLSRSATSSRWIEGLLMDSWYRLNSCRSCNVFPCIFRNWERSFPAILRSKISKKYHIYGGFQLVDLIITELKDHMICYKIKCSHWWKFIYKKKSFTRLSSLNAVISTNERNWILTNHVIFKLRYSQIYQLKTTHVEQIHK